MAASFVLDGTKLNAAPAATFAFGSRLLGNKEYDLSDHLGNVTVQLSDRKTGTLVTGDVQAEVLSYQQYYPFGWSVPGRSLNEGNARFGFNGMEKNTEISNGNYTTHFRTLDTRIGRWLSNDPVTHSYMSPYNSMGNNPIVGTDVMGSNTESTITDKDGNVLHIVNDGRSDIYRANDISISDYFGEDEDLNNIKRGLLEIRLGLDDENFEYMGESLHEFDYADADRLDEGILTVGVGARIDFNSNWASEEFDKAWTDLMDNNYMGLTMPLDYFLNARSGHKYDLKTLNNKPTESVYYGSLFATDFYPDGRRVPIYASARGAGNFLAGVIQESMWIRSDITGAGFGAYQKAGCVFCGSMIYHTFGNLKDITVGGVEPFFGEQLQSGMSIWMGQEWMRNARESVHQTELYVPEINNARYWNK